MKSTLIAGANEIDITPSTSQFLFGYPHVERYSSEIDTPLYSSCLFLDDHRTQCMFISNDLIYLSRQHVEEIRRAVYDKTGVSPENIMVTCTHTHSGPVTVERIARQADNVVPPPDDEYMDWCTNRIIEGAVQAFHTMEPVMVGFGIADSTGVGTNRHDPAGPCNPAVPVLAVKSIAGDTIKAIMSVCSIHPTVLHEDSLLISADFPGYCRKYLKDTIASCPIIYHTGPAGNQSPRYVTRENTPAEAKRLGEILGQSVRKTIQTMDYKNTAPLYSASGYVVFPLNELPAPNEAKKIERQAWDTFQHLKRQQLDSKETRAAECDWFGAERRLHLSELNKTGEFAKQAAQRLPAEVQVVKVGNYTFVSWPGEIFVEYALEIMREFENTFVIAYANGETQGYLVTEKAVLEGRYEAGTAIFKSPDSPNLLVEKTRELLNMCYKGLPRLLS